VSRITAGGVARDALLFARRPQVFLSRRSYVLVLGHMRSYSSLLCHILGSHREIDGYAEMHLAYGNRIDLLRLRARVSRSLEPPLCGRFVLDKVLHDHYAVAPSIIGRKDVYSIILVREPAETVRSIVDLGARIPSVRWYSDADAVVEYYTKRLRTLVDLARHASRLHFVRAETVVGESGAALPAVERFLELQQPLSAEYATFRYTGAVGWGDDSPAIGAGRILPRPAEALTRDVSKETLAPAMRAYEECCSVLAG
jgi:hypothetical protein